LLVLACVLRATTKKGRQLLSSPPIFSSRTATAPEPVQLAVFENYCLRLLLVLLRIIDNRRCTIRMYVGILCTGLYSILIARKAPRSINGFGNLSLQHVLKMRKVKRYFHLSLLYADNSLLLDLFWLHYYGDCYSADDCLRYV